METFSDGNEGVSYKARKYTEKASDEGPEPHF